LQESSYGIGIGGGLTNFEFLVRKPWTIELSLNEWMRFTRPGEYKLRVTSERVSRRDKDTPLRADSDLPQPSATSPVTAVSNELNFKIIPVDPDWERRVVEQ